MTMRSISGFLLLCVGALAVWVLVQIRDRDEHKRMRTTGMQVMMSLFPLYIDQVGKNYLHAWDAEADHAATSVALREGSLARAAWFDDHEYCACYFKFLEERAGPYEDSLRPTLARSKETLLAAHPPRKRP